MWYVVLIDNKPVRYYSYLKSAFNYSKKRVKQDTKKSIICDKAGNIVGCVYAKKDGYCFSCCMKRGENNG